MRTNLEIKQVEEKPMKNGKPYWRVETQDGWLSCFDSKEAESLMKLVGKGAICDIKESGKFKNIEKVCGNEFEVITVPSGPEESPKEIKVPSNSREATFYTAYAKDIFCDLVKWAGAKQMDTTAIMAESINLVKQARASFEK